MKLSCDGLNKFDLVVIGLTIVFSILLPRLPHNLSCHPATRVGVYAIVILLCSKIRPSLSVPLSLLLVLSNVPCFAPVLVVPSSLETFENPKSSNEATSKQEKDEDSLNIDFVRSASDSATMLNHTDISEKMEIFKKLNAKRGDFQKQLEALKKDLTGIKELYANASKSKLSFDSKKSKAE